MRSKWGPRIPDVLVHAKMHNLGGEIDLKIEGGKSCVEMAGERIFRILSSIHQSEK
jgi:hypothetical protein